MPPINESSPLAYVFAATMHPSMQFDGIHPGPTGLTYYITQTLAAG
jgi:hypothetical protein